MTIVSAQDGGKAADAPMSSRLNATILGNSVEILGRHTHTTPICGQMMPGQAIQHLRQQIDADLSSETILPEDG